MGMTLLKLLTLPGCW